MKHLSILFLTAVLSGCIVHDKIENLFDTVYIHEIPADLTCGDAIVKRQMRPQEVAARFNLQRLTLEEYNAGYIGYLPQRECCSIVRIRCPDDVREFGFFNQQSGGRLRFVRHPDDAAF